MYSVEFFHSKNKIQFLWIVLYTFLTILVWRILYLVHKNTKKLTGQYLVILISHLVFNCVFVGFRAVSDRMKGRTVFFLWNFRYDSSSSPPFGTLQVNNGAQLIGVVKGRLRGIQLYNNWYVGGVPQGFDMRSETRGNSAPSTSFVGSIRDVQVNGETINLSGKLYSLIS